MYDILIWVLSIVTIWFLFAVIEYSAGNSILFREAGWKSFRLITKILIVISIVMIIEKFF